jgi:SAM-dependent methyltransferase
MNYQSETEKYRMLTTKYCGGCGIDIASQGDPVVPWAWSFDLPQDEFLVYNSNNPPRSPIPLRGHADKLPVSDGSLDFVYSSHLLEDYLEEQWTAVLTEWSRVLKVGGFLIVLCPERTLWAAALAKGQPPNCAHKYEPFVGDFARLKPSCLKVVKEELTNLFEGDYSILFVGEKVDAAPVKA